MTRVLTINPLGQERSQAFITEAELTIQLLIRRQFLSSGCTGRRSPAPLEKAERAGAGAAPRMAAFTEKVPRKPRKNLVRGSHGGLTRRRQGKGNLPQNFLR